MTDSTAGRVMTSVAGLLIGLLLATTVGWGTLILGGRTDDAGRVGIALGGAVFALVSIAWRRGLRGWLWGLAAAAVLGGALLAHFWSRIGRLP